MKIVAISDTHEQERGITLPEGDVLIHAGDITKRGSLIALYQFCSWMKEQPFKHKVIICGNHDFCFQNTNADVARATMKEYGFTYLQDSEVTIEGIKFWGAPWQPWFHDWAFNLARGEEIAAKWAMIPEDTNVLITHGPPLGILDAVQGDGLFIPDERLGCADLLKRVKTLPALKAHFFGHIHPGHGVLTDENGVQFVNASMCGNSRQHQIAYEPIVINI